MAAISNVPQLVDTKGDSSSSVAPLLEPEKVNKWKKCMLCFLMGMECIKDGPFKPKTAKSANKLESQWTPDERRVDFQENYNDKADKRTSEEYLRDLDIEFHERALLANSKLLRGFQYKFPPKFIQSTQHAQSSLGEPKDEEEVSEDEEEKIDQVLMALADDELSVGKNHARNGEWIDITMKKVNILLSMDEGLDWQINLKYINIYLKYFEEQRLNLVSKYNKIVFELNKCRDDLLALKQAKLEAVCNTPKLRYTTEYNNWGATS
ncbi:hypothetical protein Tco_1053360 [Tanacetum coccineum]